MNPSLENRRIVLAVSGGIAVYKAADLASRLRKAGAEVRVAMTEAATHFVGALTFETLVGYPVYKDVLEQAGAWEMDHIGWARWAEAMVIAPATANIMAKLAHGITDDAVTTLALALRAPLWIAPAMNTAMWEHPATRANLATLRERGVRVIDPAAGNLACGEIGAGRMAEPADIVERLAAGFAGAAAAPETVTAENQTLAGKTVLVTTGPTRESLDPIRFISNRSSGRMGCELAAEAKRRGARVILIHGPIAVPIPEGVEPVPIDSARDLLAAVQSKWPGVDLAVFAAAVANYESAGPSTGKIKGGETLKLELKRTPDIAAWCGANRRPGQVLVGFAAESENLLNAAKTKLRVKGLDWICANAIGQPGLGFAAEANQVTLIAADGRQSPSPVMDKHELAGWIWDRVAG